VRGVDSVLRESAHEAVDPRGVVQTVDALREGRTHVCEAVMRRTANIISIRLHACCCELQMSAAASARPFACRLAARALTVISHSASAKDACAWVSMRSATNAASQRYAREAHAGDTSGCGAYASRVDESVSVRSVVSALGGGARARG
jgi:hypothetical protein